MDILRGSCPGWSNWVFRNICLELVYNVEVDSHWYNYQLPNWTIKQQTLESQLFSPLYHLVFYFNPTDHHSLKKIEIQIQKSLSGSSLLLFFRQNHARLSQIDNNPDFRLRLESVESHITRTCLLPRGRPTVWGGRCQAHNALQHQEQGPKSEGAQAEVGQSLWDWSFLCKESRHLLLPRRDASLRSRAHPEHSPQRQECSCSLWRLQGEIRK